MFICYIFHDPPGERWQSGLISKTDVPKPSLAALTAVASQYDPSNPTLVIWALPNPTVPLSVLEFKAHKLPGDPPLGMTYKVYDATGMLVAVAQPTAAIDTRGQ